MQFKNQYAKDLVQKTMADESLKEIGWRHAARKLAADLSAALGRTHEPRPDSYADLEQIASDTGLDVNQVEHFMTAFDQGCLSQRNASAEIVEGIAVA